MIMYQLKDNNEKFMLHNGQVVCYTMNFGRLATIITVKTKDQLLGQFTVDNAGKISDVMFVESLEPKLFRQIITKLVG